MDFGFSPEQKSLGEVVGQVLAGFPDLIAPDPASGTDDAVWKALAEIGLFALLVPENHGGVGLTLVDLALAVERLGGALASPLVAHTLIATDLLVRHGSPAQKAALLPAIGTGSLRIALATQEAGHGFVEPAGTLSLRGRVNGAKILVASAAQADWFVVSATSNGEAGFVLVSRQESGLTLRQQESLDPSAKFAAISLADAACEAIDNLSNGPSTPLARILDVGPALTAGLQTGIAARMLDASIEYASTRTQFGQPIGSFQTIKHRCADLAVALDAAKSAAYYAFWAVSEDAPDRARASSMAKAYCGEVARDACNDAIQIHGGMGFTWDLGLHRYLRRAKVLEQSFGDQAWHYERVLTETLLPDRSLP